MSNKLLFGLIAAGIAVILLVAGLTGDNSTDQAVNEPLKPARSLRDVHGLAVDVKDPDKLYIASHHGLYLLRNDTDLFQVGNARHDFMGFSAHPTDSDTFFVSGHPATGGNLGFQKSTDGGVTWKKISDGLNGPVDFHSMTVDQIDPSVAYGIYQARMQKSTDGGVNWSYVKAAPQGVVQLVAGAKKDVVYAATQNGLYVSKNQGSSWAKLPSLSGTVVSLAVNPSNGDELLTYSQQEGFVKSEDGGKSWEEIDASFSDDIVLYADYAKSDPTIIYTITQSLNIYKSADSGRTWTQVR